MSVYKPWYLTKYLASAIQSANTSANKITFKYMFGSSDSIDEKDYSGLTNDLMKSIKLDDIAKISSNEVSNTDATIVAVFTNKGVTKDHTLNTIGIVAEYNGKEFLAAICSANTPYLMPQESDNEHVEYTIRAVLGISNTGVVTVSMDPSAVATNEQLDKVRDSLKETDNLAQDNSKKIGLINSDLSSGDIARVSKSNSFKGPVTVNGDLTTTAGTNFNSLWVNNSSYLMGPTFISGNTSINRDLTVNGSLHATADKANSLNPNNGYQVNGLQTNGALLANAGASIKGNTDISGDTYAKSLNAKNWSKFDGGIEVNNGITSNGWANFAGLYARSNISTDGNVIANGYAISKRSAMRTVPTPTGMTLLFHRIGTGVMVTAYGESKAIGQFSPIGVGTPVGFRPPIGTHATLYNGFTGGTIAFFETGSIWAGAEDIGAGTARMHGYWNTQDDWPD